MADDEARAEEIARRVAGTRFRRAFEYYAMADVSPRADAKRLATCNYGWSTETIDTLLDRGVSLLERGTFAVPTEGASPVSG